MTNSPFKTFNAYLPYGDLPDALRMGSQKSYEISLRCFPESADSKPREGTNIGSENNPTPNEDVSKSADYGPRLSDEKTLNPEDNWEDFEINALMSTKDVDRLKRWIQKFRDQNVQVDINRITRYAIYEGGNELVKYLVEGEGGKLEQKDKRGRSTIFYAVKRDDPTMVRYICKKIGTKTFQEEMNHQDVDKRTPWYYAAGSPSIAFIETCLAAGARPNDDVVTMVEKAPFLRESVNQSLLLLILYSHLHSYLDFPVYAEIFKDKKFLPATKLLKILELHTNPGLLPDNERGLTWIHIPWTNGVILWAAFRAIYNRIQSREENRDKHLFERRCLKFFLKSFRDSPVVIGNPDLSYREPIHELGGREPFGKASITAVVFPCLVLYSMEDFTASRKFHHDLKESIKWDFAKNLTQVARTLDEAYYPSLDQGLLEKRNKDQVVSREFRKLAKGKLVSKDTKPILMVPQIWIWKFEDHILSAYSAPGKNPELLRDSDISDINRGLYEWRGLIEDWKGNVTRISTTCKYEDPDLHIGLLLAHHIDKFGELQANIFQSPLDIFETGVIQVISRVEGFMKQPTSLKPDDIKKERDFMHAISDIRDELAMVDVILLQQESILNSVIKNANVQTAESQSWHVVVEANPKLNIYRERVKKIDRDAERIEKNIQDQLNLKRTYASVRDTHNGIVLSTAVIGFTIVTVIFTPLAFMASLFALPIDGLVKHQSKDKIYATSYIGKWFGTAELVSLAITGLAVWISLLLLKTFGSSMNDDPKLMNDDPKNDEEKTASGSKTTRSWNTRRFFGRSRKSEKVSV